MKITGSGANTTIIDGGLVNTLVKISNTGANVTLSKVTIRNGTATNGGGISNGGTLTVNNSTFSGNSVSPLPSHRNRSSGGGISNGGTLMINTSTINGNTVGGVAYGGGILNYGTLTISNSTLSGNSARGYGGGIDIYSGTASLQNSIVANSPSGGNCYGTMISGGYNLSSDDTCNFSNTGDLNNTDPKLGSLQNNGGPTQTMALPSGSRAIDAGNPSGCTDGRGHLLTTDERGQPLPDKEDSGGCDLRLFLCGLTSRLWFHCRPQSWSIV